jgi:hypothetical protein
MRHAAALLAVLLAGCAAGSGTARWCLACGEVTLQKEESPNKPADFETLKRD